MIGFEMMPRELLRVLLRHSVALQVYSALRLRARWKAGTALRGRHGVVRLEVGEAAFGRKELAAEVGASETQIRTATALLESIGAITVKATKCGSIATICSYGENAESQTAEDPSSRQQLSQATADESAKQSPTEQPLTYTSIREDVENTDSRPSGLCIVRTRLDEQAIAIADAAVAAINRIATTSYRADSKDTLAKARALAKEGLTAEQVVQAVEHVAKSWRGTQYPIRPSTLLQAARVRTTLEDLQARASAPRRPAAPSGLTFKLGDVVVDEEGRVVP